MLLLLLVEKFKGHFSPPYPQRLVTLAFGRYSVQLGTKCTGEGLRDVICPGEH